MLHLMLGRASTAKTELMLERLKQGVAEGQHQILLVPEQNSHDTERRLCQVLGNKPGAEVMTFTWMYRRVCDRTGGGADLYLDAGGRLLLMYLALKDAEKNLTIYSNPSGRRSFLAGLLETVDECKRYEISPEDLARAGEQIAGLEGEKLRDLSMIFSAYDHLTQNIAADPRDRMTRLAEMMARSDWPRDCQIWVDHFTDFTPQELDILQQLMYNGNDVTVLLTCQDDIGQDGDIFEAARHTAHLMMVMAAEADTTVKKELIRTKRDCAPALFYLQEKLFSGSVLPYPDPCPELRLYAGDTVRDEVEYAASMILYLVQQEHCRFRDIIVTARQFSRYSALIESIFDQCGIPLFLSSVSDILEKPVLTLITAALDAVSGGYRYEDLFRYLKTGLTGLTEEQCDRLENYALTWNLRGSQWTAQADWTMHPKGYGLEFRDEDRELLNQLNDSRRRILKPLEKLRKTKEKTGRGFTMALYQLLEDIELPRRLEERAYELEDLGERKLADEYRQLWDILTGAMEQCAVLLGDKPMPLEEFSEVFQLMLSQYNVGTIPVSLDRVTAEDAPRVVQRQAKYVIFLGADNASLPLVGPLPGLLTARDREQLLTQGLEMTVTQDEKLTRELAVVYHVCAIPSRKLVVTWSKQSSSGGEQGPSFLVERMKKLFPGNLQEDTSNSLLSFAPDLALDRAGQEEALYAALSQLSDYAETVEQIRHGAVLERASLSPDTVRSLYGKTVSMSATKMDLLRSCHFSYFMEFGLKARPRQQAEFNAPEYGSFVHEVLEQVLRAVQAGDPRPVRELVDLSFAQYKEKIMPNMQQATSREQWLFWNLKGTIYAIVENAVEELQVSQFAPLDFELAFGPGKTLPPILVQEQGLQLSLSGKVDRVDGWTKDGTTYLRVIDYKTGTKTFDFTDLENGLSLQMPLYLSALEQQGYGGKAVEKAGVLYVHAKDISISGHPDMSPEELQAERDKKLQRDGLVLNDPDVLQAMENWGTGNPRFLPVSNKKGVITGDALATSEQFQLLSDRIMETLHAIAGEMASGITKADPYWRNSNRNACRYCKFRQACHFETCFGDRKRWQPKVKSEEFWEHLEGKEG